MIKAIILDGQHQGHVLNVAQPLPSLRVARTPSLRLASVAECDTTIETALHAEYLMAFKPTDGGTWLYTVNGDSDTFYRQNRDWVERDAYRQSIQRDPLIFENNSPYPKDHTDKIERLKKIIKENVVAKHGFDLEGHLWVLSHS